MISNDLELGEVQNSSDTVLNWEEVLNTSQE